MLKINGTTWMGTVLLGGLLLAAGCKQMEEATATVTDVAVQNRILSREDGSRVKTVAKASTKMVNSASDMSIQDEKDVGESCAVDAFQRFNWDKVSNEELQRYVSTLGQSIAQLSDRPQIPFYFEVVNDEQFNAFAMPGGYIFVTKGLLKQLDNEAQLAVVLAHEIAHVSKKHALGQIKRGMFMSGLNDVVSATGNLSPADAAKLKGMVSEIVTGLLEKGLSQDKEYEADELGLKYAARVGYNPAPYIQVLEKLEKMEAAAKNDPAHSGGWIKTHPAASSRIAQLKPMLKQYAANKNAPETERRWLKYKGML